MGCPVTGSIQKEDHFHTIYTYIHTYITSNIEFYTTTSLITHKDDHTCCLEQPENRAHRWHYTAEKRLLQGGAFGTLRGDFHYLTIFRLKD